MSASPTNWPRYRLYGLTMASDFPFANRLAQGSNPPDLTFTRVTEAPERLDLDHAEPLYAGPPYNAVGRPVISIHPLPGEERREGLVVRFRGSVDYDLYEDRIVAHLLKPDCDYLVEIQFLGHVLSIWLESKAIPMLHASAVVVNGRAQVFLASNKGGKSSLAASLMQAGHPMLTDDILPIEAQDDSRIVGRPGYPQMRLWPEQAAHFLGEYRDLDFVHPAFDKRRVPVGAGGLGRFHDQAAPLGCLWLPEMADDSPEIAVEPVSHREVLMRLLSGTFVAPFVEALGWQSRRLDILGRIARDVPAYRLRYPRSMDRLPAVRNRLLAVSSGLEGRGVQCLVQPKALTP